MAVLGLAMMGLAASAQAATLSLSFERPAYNFGVVTPTGESTPSKSFTLTNTGDLTLSLDSPALTWSPQEFANPEIFKITGDSCGSTLAPAESCALDISFNTFRPGLMQGTLSMVGIGPFVHTYATAQLQLEGTGQTVSFTPQIVSFKPLAIENGSFSSKTVVVTNEGYLDLTIFDVALAARDRLTADQFRIDGGSCNSDVVIPPLGTCTVKVRLTPTISGALSAQLQIIDSASGGQQSATLEGEGLTVPVPFESQLGSASHIPRVLIHRSPSKLTIDRNATFSFSGENMLTTFACKLDSAPFLPCKSPARFQRLGTGSHYFAVRAFDANNNIIAETARYQWKIEAR